jgi:BirA family transcriptional regulator, biotin operon repressor / biotin---[acetyl-CoA-carboxylase] ligase
VLSRAGYLGPRFQNDPDPTMKSPADHVTPFATPERLELVDSTNRYLLDLVSRGLASGAEVPDGYAVVAEQQSHGRGRLGRRWEAPAGSAVLCSILLRPALEPDRLHLAAWSVALGAAQACRESAGIGVSLKWPNDLVTELESGDAELAPGHGASERKVGGLLAEVVGSQRRGAPGGSGAGRIAEAVVVGIGINVNWAADWPPADAKDPEMRSIAARATSLDRLAGHAVDRDDLVDRLLRYTGARAGMLATHEGRQLLAGEYRRASTTIGREVRVDLGDETFTGTALDVDDAGCLLVSTGVCIRTVAAGDIVHLR